jgi:hypothetical protein
MPHVQGDGASASKKRALGITANPGGLSWTFVTGDVLEALTVEEEKDITPPANLKMRGEQLDWLLEETALTLRRLKPDMIVVEKPGAGFARERAEIEGLVLVAAHRANIPLEMLVKEGCRARLGRPAGKGAFKKLLDEPDVRARSNAAKRERYVFAKTALKLAGAT